MMDFAARGILRAVRSGSAAVALLCAALGVGTAAAVFILLYKVVLEPLPYEDPERLVTVWELEQKEKILRPLSAVTFLDVDSESEVFESVAAWNVRQVIVTGSGGAENVSAAAVTPRFFPEVLRTRAAFGRARWFSAGEEAAGEDAIVVLAHSFWRRRFGGDPDVLGRAMDIDGKPHEVIGVLEEGFTFENPEAELLASFDVWLPLDVEGYRRFGRGTRFLRVLGRLHDGVGLDKAESELETLGRRIASSSPETNASYGLVIAPLRPKLVEHVRSELLILFGGGAFVLLIACGCVTGLLLIRVVERRREFAVQAALGASRWRIGIEAGWEVLVIWLLAGALGAVPAVWVAKLLVAASPVEVPRLEAAGLGLSAGFFALGFAALGALVCLPIVAASTVRAVSFDALRDSAVGSRVRGRLRGLLVVAELALTVTLLATGGLLLKSFWQMAHVELGFVPDEVLTAHLALPRSRYGEKHQIRAFYAELARRLEALPEVQRAGLTMALPLTGIEISTDVTAETAEGPWREEVSIRVVSPGYFEAMGLRLPEGRAFTEADLEAGGALVVNRAFARGVWRGEAPRGRVAVDWFGTEIAGPVVGVAADVRFGRLDETREPAVYVNVEQLPNRGLHLVLRTSGDPDKSRAPLRAIVADLDAELPVDKIEPMSAIVARATARQRFMAWLGMAFAVLALALSALSLYSVAAYSVSRRTREFGIRMALGARSAEVLRETLATGGVLILASLVLGVGAALATGRLLAGLLYEVYPADLTIIASSAVTVAVIALAAQLVPARRASRLDPARSLRYE